MELFRRYLTPTSNDTRFEWLYCASPHGKGRAWLAYDRARCALAGAAAAFPRRMSFNSTERFGWVLGDFCVAEQFRSLGLALRLQRECLAAISTAPFDFCYDFPSRGMSAVYKRLGLPHRGTIVRWARPIRSARQIEKIVPSKTLSRLLGAATDNLLTRLYWKGEDSDVDLCLQDGRCGEEFTDFDRTIRKRLGLFTVRDAAYLNWRFLSHPSLRHEILTARRAGRLLGYVVFSREIKDASIVDLCCTEEPALIARLISGAVDHLRRAGATTISLNAGDKHPWTSIFHRVGFRPREESPVVFYERPGTSTSLVASSHAWYLMRGERDS